MDDVLITGVAGHVGSRLADWILNNTDSRVFGIDNLSSGYIENVPEGVNFIEKDLRDVKLHKGFDYVYHLGAMAQECLSPFVRKYHADNNLLGWSNLLNQVLKNGGCKRLVFTSSCAVYGPGCTPFNERQPCIPSDPYGAGKLYVENDLRIAGAQHGLDWCVVRPHNLYGPYQSLWDGYRNVLGIWMRQTLEGKPLTIYGDGEQTRAFSYLSDCLPALWSAATAYGASREVINLGGERPTSLNQLASLFGSVTGNLVEHLPSRHEVKHSYTTVERSRAILGYREGTTLEAGIRAMWSWAKEAWETYPERRDATGIELELEAPSWANQSYASP